MATAVSLINMKGGVGKTTLAAQLAHAAANDNLRTLAVDLDPQSNLSHSVMGVRNYVKHLQDGRPTVAQITERPRCRQGFPKSTRGSTRWRR